MIGSRHINKKWNSQIFYSRFLRNCHVPTLLWTYVCRYLGAYIRNIDKIAENIGT